MTETMTQHSNQPTTATIELLGKSFQIKCQESEVPALLKAAEYLNNTLKALPNPNKLPSPEKLGIMAALNLASQLLQLEERTNQQAHALNHRLDNIQAKLDSALSFPEHHAPFRLEIESAQA